MIAIDGHSAAGKSSLAGAIAAQWPTATIIHTDDFYRPLDPTYRNGLDAAGGFAEYYDWQRLAAEVLEPLRQSATARYEAYDWASNSFHGEVEAGPSGLIVVEGCYSARPELRRFYDACIVVQTQSTRRAQRRSSRDDRQVWVDRWDAAERYYFERYPAADYADVIVEGV